MVLIEAVVVLVGDFGVVCGFELELSTSLVDAELNEDPTCVSTTLDPRGRVLLPLLWLEWLVVLEVVVDPLCELCLLPMAFKYVCIVWTDVVWM